MKQPRCPVHVHVDGTFPENPEALRDYVQIMIEVWRNLAVDDNAWERYCKLKGIDPKTAERPVDPSPHS